jgi:hypothetical protein
MGFKPINMKQCLALAAMIVVMGAVLPEEKLPATTGKSHFTAPELTYTRMDNPHPLTSNGFLDNINLSYDSGVEIHDPAPQSASRSLQGGLTEGSFDRLPPKSGPVPKPGFTVADRKLNYQLLGSGGFAFKLNLAPDYPYPEASVPRGVDSGFGISIKF